MFVTRIGENSKYIITGDLEQSDIQKHKSGLEDAIKRFAGVHGVGLAQFKEKDVVRHSLVKRLLKRYKPSFQTMDDVPAEDTISMWVHDEGLDAPADGSIENLGVPHDFEYYSSKESFLGKVSDKLKRYSKK
jgi:hypothetical protein